MENYRANPPELTVITGPMFSGKTKAIMDLALQCSDPGDVLVYAPKISDRYDDARIKSHDGRTLDRPGLRILEDFDPREKALLYLWDEYSLFAECQYDNVRWLMNAPHNACAAIVVAGLDRDAFDRPFESMARVMCLATSVKKLAGECFVCGIPATMSYRKTKESSKVVIGGADKYSPCCRYCYMILTGT